MAQIAFSNLTGCPLIPPCVQGPVPGVPSGGLHVMARIAEEEGGSSSQDKQKQSGEWPTVGFHYQCWHLVAQIAEEEGGSSSQDKQK